jgi:hypothetical protein
MKLGALGIFALHHVRMQGFGRHILVNAQENLSRKEWAQEEWVA